MKNFQDNLDEASINQESADQFASASSTSESFRRKVVRMLSRYSLLIIIGLAALSITVLHFQGQHLLQALRGTPLPIFGLNETVDDSPLPDKTKVYEEALAEEADQVVRPTWQKGYRQLTVAPDTTTQDTVMVQENTPVVKRTVRKKRRARKQPEVVPAPPLVEETISFFQPVRAVSLSTNRAFLSCVVHGDQEVDNQTRIVLRLTGEATVGGQTVPAGTLIYGMARLGQDRLQVTIARIGAQVVQYQVYDHTYHEGILLDEPERDVQQTTQETAVRQTMRNTYRLPSQIASEVARDLLQQTRRRKQSIFLPDGYPLYISTNQP